MPADPAHPAGLPLPGDPARTIHPSALSFSSHLTPGHPSARHRGPSSVRGVNNPRDLGRRLGPRACLLRARAGGVPRAQGEGRRWALTPLAALRCHVHPTGTESGAQRGHRSSDPRWGGQAPPQRGLAAGHPIRTHTSKDRTPARGRPHAHPPSRSPLGAGSAGSCPPGPTHRAPPALAAQAPAATSTRGTETVGL